MRQAWEAVFVPWMPYTHDTDVVELFAKYLLSVPKPTSARQHALHWFAACAC